MMECTKYPILLLHGVNCNDFQPINYWGRIPEMMQNNGLQVYFGGQDAWGTIEKNALGIKNKLIEVIESAACEKVNIIAHSKGGLEARYLISALGMAPYIASLTTISTPHYGLKTINVIYRHPHLMKLISHMINFYGKIIGDQEPDAYQVIYGLSEEYCKTFNHNMTDHDDVFYQSFSTSMKKGADDLALLLSRSLVNLYDGENDGLVPVYSAKWGSYQHIASPHEKRGISHQGIVDIKKRRLKHFDVLTFYEHVIEELARKGF